MNKKHNRGSIMNMSDIPFAKRMAIVKEKKEMDDGCDRNIFYFVYCLRLPVGF